MKYRYGDYPTKEELYIERPDAKMAEKKWQVEQKRRIKKSEKISLESKDGKKFWYVFSPHLLDLMTKISEQRGFLEALSMTSSQRKKIEEKAVSYEAYYSSHIEGAMSTLEEALKFIKGKKNFSRDESLQMIKNNKIALDYAIKQIEKPISHELVCMLQKILTRNTHKDRPITIGEYRHGPVYVVNGLGQVVYEGPPAQRVGGMMEQFIRWINEEQNVNPLLKAGIVHLYFVHVHPFDDGNGRTARALSNLVLANFGFKFVNLLSISSYFDHKRPSYYRAIQDVRNHENDLTYFLIFYMEALLASISELKNELSLNSKIKEIKELVANDVYIKLNRRQVKALRVLIQGGELLTTKKYIKLNKCSDETARKDFSSLMKLKLIKPEGGGRSRRYKLTSLNQS